jgi:hypothetical protein
MYDIYLIISSDLNRLYEGPKFNISTQYAKHLAFIFTVMLYSCGLPILLPILFVYFVLSFWIDKLMSKNVYNMIVLRFYKEPPRYSQWIHQAVIRILPLATIFHMALSLWIYGTPEIFPNVKLLITK